MIYEPCMWHNSHVSNSLRFVKLFLAACGPVSLVFAHQNNRLPNTDGEERERPGTGAGTRHQSWRGFPASRDRTEVKLSAQIIKLMNWTPQGALVWSWCCPTCPWSTSLRPCYHKSWLSSFYPPWLNSAVLKWSQLQLLVSHDSFILRPYHVWLPGSVI